MPRLRALPLLRAVRAPTTPEPAADLNGRLETASEVRGKTVTLKSFNGYVM
jgi:hypothetical protein